MTNVVSAGARESATFDQHRYAAALLRAREQGDTHIDVEITEVIDDILETLTEGGPYGYTLRPGYEDGHIRQRVARSLDEIRQCYVDIHAVNGLRAWRSATRILGEWYSFNYGWATLESKGGMVGHHENLPAGTMFDREAIVMFPTMGKIGITGELFWNKVTPRPAPDDGQTMLDVRAKLLDIHDAYLDAGRSGDIGGILSRMQPTVQTVLRDYSTDELGFLRDFNGPTELKNYLQAFYEKYTVESVEVLQRHADEWFVFAETQWTVRANADGRRFSYLIAEYIDFDDSYRAVGRIGHGTDPVPA